MQPTQNFSFKTTMQSLRFYLTFLLLLSIPSSFVNAESVTSPKEWESLPFAELSQDLTPPCLGSINTHQEFVITSNEDYEEYKKIYAPQGEYVDFKYDDTKCSMKDFDFTDRIIIGKTVTGNGCLKGLEKKVFLDKNEKQIIFLWKRQIESAIGRGCPEFISHYESWIILKKPLEKYQVSFVEN
jgi:hypothetical protein